jgi:hypothetical protein
LAQPVLVPRREALGALLLSALPPDGLHDPAGGGGGGGYGGLGGSPTAAAKGGAKGKGAVSAIWLELQKGDAHHPPAPAHDAHGGGAHACAPLPAAYSDPLQWRSPLLTGFAPPPAILRLVAAVGCLRAVPWQPPPNPPWQPPPTTAATHGAHGTHGTHGTHGHGESSSHGGGGGSSGSSGSSGSGGAVTFRQVSEGWLAGEPMVDLDELLELVARWCAREADARVAELEGLFNQRVNSGGSGAAFSGGDNNGGGDGKLQYLEYVGVMAALNDRIAHGGGSGASPRNGMPAQAAVLSPGAAFASPPPGGAAAWAASADPDANAAVPEVDQWLRFQSLHRMAAAGGDFLVDAEAFAVSLFRDNHFAVLGDSSAAVPLPAVGSRAATANHKFIQAQ